MLTAPNQTLDARIPLSLPLCAAIACAQNHTLAVKYITAIHGGFSHELLVDGLALVVCAYLD